MFDRVVTIYELTDGEVDTIIISRAEYQLLRQINWTDYPSNHSVQLYFNHKINPKYIIFRPYVGSPYMRLKFVVQKKKKK